MRSAFAAESKGADGPSVDELSPLMSSSQQRSPTLDYNSDSGVYYGRPRPDASLLLRPQHQNYGTTSTSQYRRHDSLTEDERDDDYDGFDRAFETNRTMPPSSASRLALRDFFIRPSMQTVLKETTNRYTRRTRMRSMKKFRQSLDVPQLLRVAAYCSCESSSLFKLLRWLKRIQTGQLPGGELNPNGWTHKMHMGVIHSSCVSDDREDDTISHEMRAVKRKDVFYFATGCTVFWGLTQAEEQAHVHAISAFSNGILKHVDVEEMEFCYGDNSSSVANDVVTLSSFRSSEKIAISFAMAQSCKLDVFEERVDETIQETRHIPQTLADTGEINMYSQKDISKLIGRLFIERSDINLNSDMLDDPDFFWDDDEYQPLYKHMMKYLDVDKRVHILNTRLDVLRELLDVLGEQLARQHDTNLEWIVIWVIVAAVFVKIFWNILVKDFMGLFCHN
ncbi:hypothetical protein, variant [Aphanomyces astaci]|uniref:DUF155 domain-containing protein n=1 Tax=Aphanomyces astaci TaxID=112090 RepID=W4FWX1_APHAT|nr:hypothetical protein, variant [Aphanomyces astaci]ETV71987.1 hypothetical protein, variant [Aphanomyces astaci]|eukprot:XP_009838430.1 hypothetical protein, variant [Aphanomyces astaci]